MARTTPRIVIAGTSSGVGKTAITCSIIYSLQRMGYSVVQPFKVGPDYIDPGYLASISGRNSHNLDVWLMGRDHVLDVFASNSADSDIAVIEGVMGYYDGFDGRSDHASTHHVASITASPTILVLDASKAARSIAATATGFAKFHKRSAIVGVILNKIGSPKHERLCRDALQQAKLPVVGVIPRDPRLQMQSRHLGLISTLGSRSLGSRVERVSKVISEYLDMGMIIAIAKGAAPVPKKLHRSHPVKQERVPAGTSTTTTPAITISVALDTSFNFYYHNNLAALRREGATLEFFSPVRDKQVPRCDGVYIGGGFPEVLASSLERNHSMRNEIKRLSGDGMPIYAECGGLMYLTRTITPHDNGHPPKKKQYRMAGVLDADTIMTKKMRLGYTKGIINADSIISDKTHPLRGHEFHYSRLDGVPSDSRFAYTLDVGEGIINHRDGIIQHNTLASYGHLYFDSSDYAHVFVKSCLKHSRR